VVQGRKEHPFETQFLPYFQAIILFTKHIYTSCSHEGKVYGKGPPVAVAFIIFPTTCLTETILFTRHRWVMKSCSHCHNITRIQLIHLYSSAV